VTLPAADRLDIIDVLTRADAAASARNAAAYLELFSEDAVLDGAEGTYRGVDALRRGLAAVWGSEPAGTLHLTVNPVIDDGPAPADTAVARSVLLIIDQGPPPALAATAYVTQHLRRGPAGWRITHRTVTAPSKPGQLHRPKKPADE
jgi:ketosteroid isomerase-like protein